MNNGSTTQSCRSEERIPLPKDRILCTKDHQSDVCSKKPGKQSIVKMEVDFAEIPSRRIKFDVSKNKECT